MGLLVVVLALVAVVLVRTLGNDGGDSGATAATTAVDLSSRPADLDKTLAATADSLREFWTTELPRVYHKPFEDLAGGIQPKTKDSPPWTCNGKRVTYRDIRANAFYCGGKDDDYIAYDASYLLPRLDQGFGALTPAVVLAHEFGHAIQHRAGVQAPSVVIELQADCFAGAWVAYAQSSATDPVAVDQSALDSSIRAIPLLRDQPGTPATNPKAHGLGFDRVNAFQTGYESGASRCATFPDGNVVVTELPFRTPVEALTGGNIAFGEALPFFVDHLDSYWSVALPQIPGAPAYQSPARKPAPSVPLPDCAGDPGYDRQAVTAYCVPTNTVSWATAPLARLHAQIGDMATGAALSESWARAAQAQAGLPTTGGPAELQQVCFTGAWVAAIASSRSPVQLSPGDIDEVLLTVLTPLSTQEEHAVQSTSFERADALRTGVLDGLGACLK
ncbi:neutral zinc metallopeptidase [Nocardioides aquiterrae]|uniref:Neutral zinc metallopeptidase n=1 Tax=Nocardioides aquiterrae TaxID=203799 RepID=A0ABP4F1Z3_9ACTN